MNSKLQFSTLVFSAIFFLARRGFADGPPQASLTLQQAQQIALTNHPKITEAELIALASKQVLRETRSAFFPIVNGEATAAGGASPGNTRIGAGSLSASRILDRQADGVNVSQLITDFGRTVNLTASSKLQARAQEQNVLATRAEILLAVNSAYFDTLQAQAVLEVAKQTVATRQFTRDQVNELTTNKLKSGLDLSFAQVDLDSAKLLLAGANNDLRAALAGLANVLGQREEINYRLIDEPIPSTAIADDAQLVQTALENRPDLGQLRFAEDAAKRFARAEKGLNYPTLSAAGVAGYVPAHDSYMENNYFGAGVNLSLPIFDGLLFDAREKEAQLRAKASSQALRDAEDNVIRDVRIARLNFDYAAERLDLTARLLASAKEAFELAQARYKVGSSSIVELSQAQLNETEAEIAQSRAKYEFQIRSSILSFQLGMLR
jgi:outer membrane protein